MDHTLELAEQRLPASPSASGAASSPPAPASSVAADLPVLLLAVLPLIQAIDWLDSTSAVALEALAPAVEVAPQYVSLAPAPALLEPAGIEQVLAVIEGQESTASGALVYAADVLPLSLNIRASDLFSDLGELAGVTPRLATSNFVQNVENDIFGRELNAAATPMESPASGTAPTQGVINHPMDGGSPTETEAIVVTEGNAPGWISTQPYNPDKHPAPGTTTSEPPPADAGSFTVVDLTPPPAGSDIVP